MALFNFQLFSLQESLPFDSEQNEYSLGWYDLTKGYYWLEVGSQQVLEYNKEAIQPNSIPMWSII